MDEQTYLKIYKFFNHDGWVVGFLVSMLALMVYIYYTPGPQDILVISFFGGVFLYGVLLSFVKRRYNKLREERLTPEIEKLAGALSECVDTTIDAYEHNEKDVVVYFAKRRVL